MTDPVAQTGITYERALALLTDLVEINSINPMGRSFDAARPCEAEANDYLESFFTSIGLPVVRDPFSERHENILVELPGAKDGAVSLFESHVDTVPADDWMERALIPKVEGDRVIGRGSADDKASLVGMMLAVADLVERRVTPPQGVILMGAGDEEYAQTGIKRFLEAGRTIGRGIFGEPSDLVPIVQHKGTIRWDIVTHGVSAHTSRPFNGVNAIHRACDVIASVADIEADLQQRLQSDLMTPPTITVTMIHGGRTRNAVPDECAISVDYRVLPGQDPAQARGEVIAALESLDMEISHSDVQLMTPPLATSITDPFAVAVEGVCQREFDADVRLAGVPFGTDAAWVADQCPALVLGPGSIDTAHAIDEWVDVNDIVIAARIYQEIMLTDHEAHP